jgi:sugar O-acyltransferase (sialic acid O-acetyltransferase NeuD family)
MQDLIILGAGVHALEMSDLVGAINAVCPRWRLRGFLVPADQAARRGERPIGELPVLGTYDEVDTRFADAQLAWSYGCAFSGFRPGRMATLVAPSAFVCSTARIGTGCVLYPNCFVGHGARLGDRVFALTGSIVNHDDVLGDDVTLASGAIIAGEVTVESGCYLGQSCTVRQQLRVGAGSLIGMGAVVVADVPPNSVMAGNPARRLRDRVA